MKVSRSQAVRPGFVQVVFVFRYHCRLLGLLLLHQVITKNHLIQPFTVLCVPIKYC
jgi:hypothetical protein